jgi:hypothetical protein
MNWLKQVGWGALIWVILFVWITIILFVFKLENGWLLFILSWLGVIVTTWIIAGKVELKNLGNALLIALIWVVVGLILDYFVTRQFNSQIFTSWNYWVGYALLLITPSARMMMKK